MRSRLRGLGTHSSSSSRTGFSHLAGQFERGNGVLTCHGGKIVQKLVKGIAALEVIVQRLDRHSRSNEHGYSAENVWIAMNDSGLGWHDRRPFAFQYTLGSFAVRLLKSLRAVRLFGDLAEAVAGLRNARPDIDVT